MNNEYLTHLYNYDAQASGLLGSFDSSDKYSINDNIKQELLKANKSMTSYREDMITAIAMVGAYKFDFRVLIQEGEENKKRAGLFLIEKCTQGFYEKEIQTLIHYVILPNDGAFVDTIKKEFHLYTKDESEGIDMANAMLAAILKRKSEVKAQQINSCILLKDLDHEYVLKMLSLLKSYGVYGNKVLVEFKNILNAKKLDKNSNNYWKELKVILDKLILSNAVIFDNNMMAKIEAIQNNYVSTFKQTKIPSIIENVTPEPKKKKKGGAKAVKIVLPDFKPPAFVPLNLNGTKFPTIKLFTNNKVKVQNVKQKKVEKRKEDTKEETQNVFMFGSKMNTGQREKTNSSEGRSL